MCNRCDGLWVNVPPAEDKECELSFCDGTGTELLLCEDQGKVFRYRWVCSSCSVWVMGRLKCPFDGSIEHDHRFAQIACPTG